MITLFGKAVKIKIYFIAESVIIYLEKLCCYTLLLKIDKGNLYEFYRYIITRREDKKNTEGI